MHDGRTVEISHTDKHVIHKPVSGRFRLVRLRSEFRLLLAGVDLHAAQAQAWNVGTCQGFVRDRESLAAESSYGADIA